ncbi:MAG: lamin tail domain-containing protein, partial [Planctomycetales bacterium]|nr:lamin tail domain-containing protein [Planctomycetales bacterium]
MRKRFNLNQSVSRFRRNEFENLEPRRLLTAAPMISEFMAVNGSTIADQDGDFSDWLELVNAGDEPVNLDGYWLTDDVDNLTKWRIPNVSLDANEYLTVFASSKDRDDPESELHTNFRLSRGGEYLALVGTDGNVVQEFRPDFPAQVADISYGLGTKVDSTTLLAVGAETRYFVPSDDSLHEQWYRPEFDDGSWSAGPNGIGFDTGVRETDPYVESVLALRPTGYWRFEESSGALIANTGSGGPDLNGTVSGDIVLDVVGPTSVQPTFGLGDTNSAATFDGTDDQVSTDQSLLNNVAQFTMAGFVKPGTLEGTNHSLFGQDVVAEFGFRNSETLRLGTRAGGRLDVDYPFPQDEWHHVAAVGTGAGLKIYIDGQLAGEGGTLVETDYGTSSRNFNIGGSVFSSSGGNFNGQIDEVALFDRALSADEIASLVNHQVADGPQFADFIKTDVQAELLNVGTSVFTRMSFQVDDPLAFNQLLLKAQYDDAFVAYLNGAEILRVNAPGESDVALSYDATAVDVRFDSLSEQFEVFDISSERDLLLRGENLLAVQVLNLSADNPDLLFVPEVEAAVVSVERDNVGYLTTPTPNEQNHPTSEKLGPVVDDVEHTPSQPTAADELLVTAEIVRTLEDVASVELAYRVMFGDEVTIAMADDGSRGDAIANDGIYSATIPAGVAQPGEMLRWKITAVDTVGATGRGPKFE